ncbi:MFS transporter [Comamonas aquatica]|uniref:MFS transporter n=1 Tax=Comamonas aquatica TaxID=225991 RepID=UPI002446B568|nr:MFS transporter [Comamonas aquatica]MDH0493654.1 MFS transporter [Comamonas aquatica]MDH1674290.1 MFS transporter [Comamonas aquatica]MDH1677649.1 MFS transporter [Comamonas aquatica]
MEIPFQNRWLTLAIVSAALFLVVIDMTVLYTALPSLAQALRTTASEKLWILNAYSLVMAGLMPVLGALGDRIGHRRIFIAGMVVFGVASMLAALATTSAVLIGARVLLAIGGAAMLPATIAIIRVTFQDPSELALAIGIWAAIASGGAAVGPLLGGVLLEHFWWGSVFLINVPIIAVATLLALRYVPVRPGNAAITIDLPSCGLSMVGIIALAYGIKELAKPGGSAALALGMLVLGGATLGVFVRRQLRLERPLIDLRLLAQAPIATGMLVASMTLIGFELVLSQRLQLVVGKSPLEAGAFVLPISLGSFFAGPLAGAVIGRIGCVRVIAAGLAMTALGIAGYLLLRDGSVLAQVLVLTVCGIGIGASLTASSTLVMSNVSEDRAGMAGSVEGVAYEFGGGFGVTIFGSLMTAVYVSTVDRLGFAVHAGSSLDEAHAHARAHPEAQAMLQAAMQAFETSFTWVSVAVAAILLALVLAVLGQRRRLGAAGEAPRVAAH